MSWSKIEGEEFEFQVLRDMLDQHMDVSSLEALRRSTPFYRNGELVSVTDGTRVSMMVAVGSDRSALRAYYPLNGSVENLREVNKAAELALTEENAGAYLCFFHAAIAIATADNFAVVESLDGYGVIGADGKHWKKPADMSLLCLGLGMNDTDDAFLLWGHALYSDDLHAVHFQIDKEGWVELLDNDRIGRIVRLH
jgi:hypothetical protein